MWSAVLWGRPCSWGALCCYCCCGGEGVGGGEGEAGAATAAVVEEVRGGEEGRQVLLLLLQLLPLQRCIQLARGGAHPWTFPSPLPLSQKNAYRYSALRAPPAHLPACPPTLTHKRTPTCCMPISLPAACTSANRPQPLKPSWCAHRGSSPALFGSSKAASTQGGDVLGGPTNKPDRVYSSHSGAGVRADVKRGSASQHEGRSVKRVSAGQPDGGPAERQTAGSAGLSPASNHSPTQFTPEVLTAGLGF